MIRSFRFTCILDTNVIYPIEIRDLLFWFAYLDLYIPKWSKHIFDEWEIVMRRRGVEENEISKRMNKATSTFPNALVENYEPFIELLNLPDPKDCHVLAAAIKADADIIVTNNLRDFPEDYLAKFEVSAKSADNFLTDMINLDKEIAVDGFRELVANRRNPNLNEYEVLEAFQRNGLTNTADYLRRLI